ncbi:protein-glutamate O-methyltransferase CheR [Methylosinus sp. H3A]|uniref:CheR family methyltransferase n=1 Tax=Methylosinus sp. H3A TaxID=2785786 RepID=UPI0018C2B1A8|nr:protein-glutamate O-methyltransferase CheR [Methylosinus sp. H3A]MBG0809170.1 protein-glutamate O-methyltransferase CheR [Methylosinus sp. H3A]
MSVAFARLRRLIGSLAGISLDADKLYFAQSRLEPIMRAHGCFDLAQLMRLIEKREDESLLQRVIDAMTNNETSFFRDRVPFEKLKQEWLPDLMARRAATRRLRIWSAACSTGQEAYSIAMALEESEPDLEDWTVEILATDISEAALEAARRGVYSQFEAQRGLSTARLLRHLHPHKRHWRVSDALQARVAFRKVNLLSDFRGAGPFDVIFCRNVLMYFEPEVKRDVLTRLFGVLAEDGFLILGAAETMEFDERFAPSASGDCRVLPRRFAPRRRLANG